MSLNDPLANALSRIFIYEKEAKKECLIKPVSKTVKKILQIMNEHGYLGSFQEIEDGKGGIIRVNLIGTINKCGVIKPRFSVKRNEIEKFEQRYLPAKDIGIILISTSKGIITHIEAKKKNLGGRLLIYCY